MFASRLVFDKVLDRTVVVFDIAIASYILLSYNPMLPNSRVSKADTVNKTMIIATDVPRDLRFSFISWPPVYWSTAVTGLYVPQIPEP